MVGLDNEAGFSKSCVLEDSSRRLIQGVDLQADAALCFYDEAKGNSTEEQTAQDR
jgi:hypothetical protein